jgi:pimeloyl-ACP methyl ester carboxylesterase
MRSTSDTSPAPAIGLALGALRSLKPLFLVLPLIVLPWLALAQERTTMTVLVDGAPYELATTTYKPPGKGPFPVLVFHHGSTGAGTDPSAFRQPYEPMSLAYWFVSRGWAVVVPSRRGRGGSEGLYDEGFAADRARGYTCDETLSLRGAYRALRDVDAVTNSVLALPFVDRSRLLVGGHSRGGILAIAWAGQHPDRPRGVINYVGGWIGDRCLTASSVNQRLFNEGAAFSHPTLWLYGNYDQVYPLAHSRANFDKFRAAGGKGRFHEVNKSSPLANGHQIEDRFDLWSEMVETYLRDLDLPFAVVSDAQRLATDDEIRTAFSGRTVDWGPDGVVEYRPDGTGELTWTPNDAVPALKYEVQYMVSPGQLCVGHPNGGHQCDTIMKTLDGYYKITNAGNQYRPRFQ